MYSQHTNAHRTACRRLAMEQNEKLFEEANALNRSAFDLLDRPDLDSEMFLQYLQLRGKADAKFREALDHLSLINEQFPALSNEPETLFGGKQVAFASLTAQGRSEWSATGETIMVPASHPRMGPKDY
ncbi:hypothetical protein PMI18_03106 [Pseudomonas sp. GM102]|uniref:hypothetical protein n=1 Tax=Pseudomonas sp. GM102 TaxID=1144321 RepID=UPI00026F7817|nr:hypothetical protein [Pseudomonas sp. GM102]EJM00378.1 hypothetical protein PMI18_03106 [Pseudomonas sp. GM102]